MKTTSAERFITLDVIRRANQALVSGSRRFDRTSISQSALAAMPSREQIDEAGRLAMARMRRRESKVPA